MTPSRKRKFTHKNRQFEVRAVPLMDGWKVRIYEKGKLVSPAVYSLSHDTAVDAQWRLNLDMIESLMALAQNDIERGIVPLVRRE
jgi:hypothetical protein